MIAKRTVPNSSKPQAFAPSRMYGISSLGLALLCACSGAIEETDADEQRVDYVEARGAAAANPTGSSTPAVTAPRATTPVATPQATTPAATPPATTPVATPPAATPPAATPPAATPPVTPASTASVSFETDVWPIFNSQCGPCHVSIGLGNQNIGADDKDAALEDAVSFKSAIVSEIQSGDMPPSCGAAPGAAGCVSVAQFDLIKSWVDGGAQP